MGIRVAIVGPPSSGKTTLAYDVAQALKKKGIVAMYSLEYVRQWMAENKTVPTIVLDQFPIFQGQLDMEEQLSATQDVFITDCATWLGPIYATTLVGNDKTKTELAEWNQVLKLIELAMRHKYDYDRNYLPPRIFDLQKEKGRVQTEESQVDDLEDRMNGFIKLFGIPVVRLSKNPDEWLDFIVNDIVNLVNAKKSSE